ncbi:TetR/AcrR family transcriptional regulator [Nocardia seriolae]|uniref:TetR family transcriptional regulator n=1 Tax=Nocardia seriolae TaxID=37332 RepID=A0ABC9Z2A4_9NOCA|nr:TetR family transcriptional regulator [Nocardia seriolae]BEK98690.1 transcriptional regulator RaaS [Nocardia seriolae]GAM49858.1 TetR family transcriptional regulator [Nocardia seriolae]GAP31847.1 TetR family transcriptional regulator [Nocardia seriolae]
MRSTDDLTTRARIRDAAITVFGEQGFGVGVRAIAAAAGVSPGLVNHHFGSKDGLREACDDWVRETVRAAKMEYIENPSPGGLMRQLAEIEDFAPGMAYLMRSLQGGGALMTPFFEHMVSDTEQYLRAGVAAGTIKPMRDVSATARFVATNNGGGMILFLQLYASEHPGPMDYRKALREYADRMMLPALEIYTHGMLTDSAALDALTTQTEQ